MTVLLVNPEKAFIIMDRPGYMKSVRRGAFDLCST